MDGHKTRKHSESDLRTSQGGRHVREPTASLTRLVRSLKRAKKEAAVVCHLWNRHTFISDIFGPKDTWLVPGYEAAEWGYILYLFKTKSVTRIIRLSITTVGSVIIPPLGVVLYSRFLFSTRAREKVYLCCNIEGVV